MAVNDLRDIGWWKRRDAGRTIRVTLGLDLSLSAHRCPVVEIQTAALAAYTGRTLELVSA